MADILIVEDDDAIANLIRMTLSLPGHNVDCAESGEQALEMVREAHYDLVILDLMLGGISGENVLTQLVIQNVVVIVVSAKSSLNDQIRCLRLGADDYITKPFNSMDLITRAEVALRVHKKLRVDRESTVFEHLTVDFEKHLILSYGVPIELTPKEYELFVYFFNNIEKTLTRKQIIQEVWGYSFSKDNRTVDIHIQRLRKKLALQSNLKTIIKVGYILEHTEHET